MKRIIKALFMQEKKSQLVSITTYFSLIKFMDIIVILYKIFVKLRNEFLNYFVTIITWFQICINIPN